MFTERMTRLHSLVNVNDDFHFPKAHLAVFDIGYSQCAKRENMHTSASGPTAKCDIERAGKSLEALSKKCYMA